MLRELRFGSTRRRARAEFTLKTKLEAMVRYVRCPGLPEKGVTCGKPFGHISDVHFDHIAREEATHDNSAENCRPLCLECHNLKTFGTKATSAGSDVHMAAKAKRLRGETKQGNKAAKARKTHPMPGSRASGWRKRMDGTVERRS